SGVQSIMQRTDASSPISAAAAQLSYPAARASQPSAASSLMSANMVFAPSAASASALAAPILVPAPVTIATLLLTPFTDNSSPEARLAAAATRPAVTEDLGTVHRRGGVLATMHPGGCNLAQERAAGVSAPRGRRHRVVSVI